MGDYTTNQFARPHGFIGKMAGWMMSIGVGNRTRNAWAVQWMQLQPTEVVLEIGFGPGLAIAQICKSVTEGCIYGVDPSPVMVTAASKRNRAAVQAGKVKLYCAAVTSLPPFEKEVDKVLTINSFEFWDAKVEALRSVKQRMRNGGQIFLVHQVQHKQGEPPVGKLAKTYLTHLEQATFTQIQVEQDATLDAVCVIGVCANQNQPSSRSKGC